MSKANIILSLPSKFFAPFIIIFALYIQINGEVSPGGGFQAGAIGATACVLIDYILNPLFLRNLANQGSLLKIASIGVMIYFGIGIICIFLGGEYLEYNVLIADHHKAQTFGIFTVELGVGICVYSVLVFIYYQFKEEDYDK